MLRFYFICITFCLVGTAYAAEQYRFINESIHTKHYDELYSKYHQFSPDVKTIAIVTSHHTIQLFGTTSWTLLKTIQSGKKSKMSSISVIAFSPDGKHLALASGDPNIIDIYDIRQDEISQTLHNVSHVISMAYSRSGRYLLSSDSEQVYQGKSTVKLWDMHSGKLVTVILNELTENYYPAQVKFSPDDAFIAVALANRQAGVLLVNLRNKEKIKIPSRNDIYAVAFHPLYQRLAYGGGSEKSGSISTWSIKDNKPIHTMNGHHGFIHSIAYAPDGRHLISSASERDARFRVWDIKQGKEVQTVFDGKKESMGLSMSPDGQTVAISLRTYGNLGNPATFSVYHTRGVNRDE